MQDQTTSGTVGDWDGTQTTLDMDLSDALPPPKVEGSGACLIQIHPIVGRCGVQYLADKTMIGRDQAADFCIVAESVSRQHASIERQPDGQYRLTDLNSTNGTFVNDVRVREWDLEPGDIVRCGGAILKVLSASDLEAHYHEVAYMMMTHDSLTGVHNRQYFLESLQRELTRSRRYETPVAVLMIDLDHFKAVNDLHGHLSGDDVLREFTRRTQTVIRSESLLARLGGEEFCVMVPEADAEHAISVAERIRTAISSRPFRIASGRVSISVSIGIAVTEGPEPPGTEDVLRQADQNLYEAKKQGRDCIHCSAVPSSQRG